MSADDYDDTGQFYDEQEPPEPNCFSCWDTGTVRTPTAQWRGPWGRIRPGRARCPLCAPTPRQRRRAERRDNRYRRCCTPSDPDPFCQCDEAPF